MTFVTATFNGGPYLYPKCLHDHHLKSLIMFRRSLLLLVIAMIASISAVAHEGHGLLPGHEPGHYLFSLEHNIPVMLVVALFVLFLANRMWVMKKKNEIE